ncbi:MAG: hydantoinase/oxoprolinase family protein [Gammaproteobacteria bacterium]|nr:hydantoinase/oxoprolinase family protein [Gammaproteobacteria bacterium]
MKAESTVRVSVDIGGTFTDLHLYDPATNRTLAFKTPSTPADPSIGLINGLQGIADLADISVGDIGLILHGSTIATNAVLERKLPRGALITTQGFRDVLEVGRHIRRDVYTLQAEPRSLLVPRHWRYGVTERIAADGTVVTPLDESALRSIVDQLVTENIETVAVVFLHGYRNPQHEQRAAEIIAERAPDISVTTSWQSSPEIREFERTSTTVLNAMLRPVISGYLERLTGRLTASGINATLYLVQSNGGLASPEDAAALPAKLLLSGPAGGAMAMAALSRRHDIPNLVGFDMGGTSSDISVVRDGHIGETTESSIDGLPVRLPMVEIRTIGAGGGSIARMESGGLRVGPESAGAEPGPVCYQRGGEEPTVTDANAVLGRIDPEAFKTGGMQLDVAAAGKAVEQHIARSISLTANRAAVGILDVATASMAAAIRLSLFEKGADPIDFALAPFGGAAGLHACAVARDLGVDRIIFPANASTLSALGILEADLRYDLSESLLMPSTADSLPSLQRAVGALREKARALLGDSGFTAEQSRIDFSCDMRYRGQAFELATAWPEASLEDALSAQSLDALVANFHRTHEERFAHAAPEDATEIVTVRAVGIGRLNAGDALQHTATGSAVVAQPPRKRALYLDDHEQDVECIRRESLQPGHEPVRGPLIIEEDYTVLLLYPGWQAKLLPGGDILCERIEGAGT